MSMGLSPTNWPNGIGDIDCCLIGLSISQSNNNDTWSRVFVEPCLLRSSLDCFYAEKAATGGPKPKQISTSDYCRICGCFVYVSSIHPVKVTDQRILFLSESCSSKFYKKKVGERFKRSWFYRFANRRAVKQGLFTSRFRGNVMQSLKCQLLSLLQLDHC